jgi:lipoate-protein ligase A
MALDEVLLAGTDARPTLRFYTWTPHALSLGYFQRWADLAPRIAGTPAVRRFSGGGAIHHADELTFSIAASLAHPLYRGEVARA